MVGVVSSAIAYLVSVRSLLFLLFTYTTNRTPQNAASISQISGIPLQEDRGGTSRRLWDRRSSKNSATSLRTPPCAETGKRTLQVEGLVSTISEDARRPPRERRFLNPGPGPLRRVSKRCRSAMGLPPETVGREERDPRPHFPRPDVRCQSHGYEHRYQTGTLS